MLLEAKVLDPVGAVQPLAIGYGGAGGAYCCLLLQGLCSLTAAGIGIPLLV